MKSCDNLNFLLNCLKLVVKAIGADIGMQAPLYPGGIGVGRAYIPNHNILLGVGHG